MGDPTTAWQLLPNGTNSARYNDSAGAAIPLGADLGLPPLPSLLRPSLGESGIARGVGRGGRTARARARRLRFARRLARAPLGRAPRSRGR
jgi:hypothetical protein